MLRNGFGVVLCLLFFIPKLQACDGCGCSLSSLYFGLTPNQSAHYVGLWWQYQRYRSLGNYGSERNESLEHFNSFEIRLRYQVNSRLSILGILPYANHHRQIEGFSSNLKGLGDVITLASYRLFSTSDSLHHNLRHRLAIGLGIKAPTGQSNRPSELDYINPNFQLGSGSWDFLFNLNYTLRWSNLGINTDVTYQWNTANNNDYKFGNRINAAISAFYMTSLKQWEFMPNFGLFLEQAEWDVQENYFRTNTGGHALFGTVGLETYWRQFNVGMVYNHPLEAEWSKGLLEPESRISIHFNVFF